MHGGVQAETASASIHARANHTLLFVLGIVLFWALIYIPGLASPPMMDDVDSEHARIAG